MTAPCWRCGRGFELDSTPLPESWVVYGPWHKERIRRAMLCGPCRWQAAAATQLDQQALTDQAGPIRVAALVGRRLD